MADRKQWYVLKVRPTFESIAIRELRKREFEAFLPENNPKLAHRANAYELILPETVFCQFDLNEQGRVLSRLGEVEVLDRGRLRLLDESMEQHHFLSIDGEELLWKAQ